jgi:hypothetical protein
MPPSFWVVSTKPEAALWRRVIAGQKPACIARWDTALSLGRSADGVESGLADVVAVETVEERKPVTQ